MSSFDSTFSNVHVFSDSVVCLGHGAKSEASRKFTNKWMDNQQCSRPTTSKGINSKLFDCTFHVNQGETSMHILTTIQEQVFHHQGRYWKRLYARDVPSQNHHLRGHDERGGGFSQRSLRPRSELPERHSYSRLRRMIKTRVLDLRRTRSGEDLAVRQVGQAGQSS